MKKSFPHYRQLDAMDCGPTCLRMIAKHYGRGFSNQTLREKSFITRSGVSMLGISEAAESIGFRSLGVQISYNQLLDSPLPCILHWNQRHFVVLHRIAKPRKCKLFPSRWPEKAGFTLPIPFFYYFFKIDSINLFCVSSSNVI